MTERVRYYLGQGLNPEQIDQVISDAYWVVEKVGVQVEPDSLRRSVAGQRGIYVTGKNVRFNPDVVNACWKAAQAADTARSQSFVIDNGGNVLSLIDFRTGEARPPRVIDLIEMSKLCDALGLSGYAPVLPQDFPPALQEVAANYYARCFARALGGGMVTGIASAEYIYEMSLVAGPPFRVEYYVASPLAFDATGLEIVQRFHGRGVPIAVGSFLLAGNSAPLSLRAAWTQWLAENLAAVSLMTYACLGDPIQWMADGGAHACDFRYTNVRAGSPEEILFRLTGIQLMRHLSVEARGTVMVMGKQPDARAAAERLAGLLTYSMAGVHEFYGAGLLGFDSIFSGEQLILDLELLAYIERVAHGMIWDSSETCRTVISRPDPITQYLTDELTLKRLRSETWSSPLFEYALLEQWRREGEESTSHRIRSMAEQAIIHHSYELTPEKKREMDTIWKRAQDEMGSSPQTIN